MRLKSPCEISSDMTPASANAFENQLPNPKYATGHKLRMSVLRSSATVTQGNVRNFCNAEIVTVCFFVVSITFSFGCGYCVL